MLIKTILILLLVQVSWASTVDKYNKARKQYILEYTVFGVDECLESNSHKLVVDASDALEGKILVGSTQYFSMLQGCFEELKRPCSGESCIVKRSMKKRLENVRYVDEMKQKLVTRQSQQKQILSKNTSQN